jgi:small subunit ribosomal protein S9
MADEESKETSEETPTEEPRAEEPKAEATEDSPADPTEDSPADPTEDTPADPGREAEESAVDGEAESPSEEESKSDSSTTSSGDESPQAPKDESEAQKKADKKDVIPGADLEPIAVEQAEENLSAEERARRDAEEEERARREAELAGEGPEEEPAAASRAPAKMESDSRYLATGKRKRSIARVTLLPGAGSFEINGRELEEFFPRPLHQTMARQPLATTGYEGSVDVRVRVHGGGVGGQAGAVRHGIARALTEIDPELRGELKRRGFLTRDARVKERRKAGLKKARKRPQFSKR